MNRPLVSIIVPLFNRQGLIIETLESIKSQTYTNWECIIVDDGSTDNSYSVVDKYINNSNDSRFKLFKRPDSCTKGAPSCRNYGFKKSIGEWVIFLDSDDILEKEMLQNNINLIKDNYSSNVLVSKTLTFENNINNITGSWPNYKHSVDLSKELISRKISWPNGNTMWCKKNLPNEPFDDSLICSQEWFLNCSMTLISDLTAIYGNHVGLFVRKHNDRIGNRININKEVSRISANSKLIKYCSKETKILLYENIQKIITNVIYRYTFKDIQYFFCEISNNIGPKIYLLTPIILLFRIIRNYGGKAKMAQNKMFYIIISKIFN